MKKKLLIFGSTSNLGELIVRKFRLKYKIVTASRSRNCRFSFKNYNLIPNIIKKVNPDIVLNLIANTSVEDCEKNKKKATIANVKIIEKIVKGIKLTSQKIKFIHISTDHLYSNKKNIPNKESDVNIVNNYARTKFEGEKIAQKHNSIIIRTNFIGKQSVKKKISLTDWVYESIKKDKMMLGYNNIFFNPLNVSTLLKYLYIIIEKKNMKGIFNLGSRGYLSKYELIKIFLKKAKKKN